MATAADPKVSVDAAGEDYRGISRALAVLAEMNRNNGCTVTGLSRATGISRPALYRILNVLADTGYIRRREDDRSYFLTIKVKTLSDGFRSETGICEIASPLLAALQHEVIWPTDLAIFRNNRLELLETTRRQSPFVIDQVLAGGELSSIFSTALGLAYLSYAAPAERAVILESYATRTDSKDSRLAQDVESAERLFDGVRREGYAWRFRGSVKETGTIAVPVLHEGYAVASIGITFMASVLSVKKAVDRHIVALTRCARDIEVELSAER